MFFNINIFLKFKFFKQTLYFSKIPIMRKLKIKKSPSYLNPTPYFTTLWVRGVVGEMSMKSSYTLLSSDYVFVDILGFLFHLKSTLKGIYYF